MFPLLALAMTTLPPQTARDHARAAKCTASTIVSFSLADMLALEDHFRDALPLADRLRLDRALPRAADGGIAQCDAGEGSRATCETTAYFPALRATGLMPRFLATLCPKPS